MKQTKIVVLAHNVRSLWNVGSFFRTADAFGIEKLYLTGYTGHPPRKEISKTAIGAEETVDWESAKEPGPIVEKLAAEGWTCIALELSDDAKPLLELPKVEKLCLIVGHELEGVPEDLRKLCASTVFIPMLGTKESLNVSVALGIALYQARFLS